MIRRGEEDTYGIRYLAERVCILLMLEIFEWNCWYFGLFVNDWRPSERSCDDNHT